MKKHHYKTSRANMNLGDLIFTVSNCSRSNRETVAAITDLLESGRVRLNSRGQKVRAHIY